MKLFYSETSTVLSARGIAQIEARTEPAHKLAVIGTGMMGREHMRVATLLGRAQVHGIHDTSSDSLNAAEADFKRYSDKKLILYPSLSAACQDPALDALIISTPNFTHWTVAREAMRSGKALLLEKPMATSLEDASAMASAAYRYSNVFQLGMQYRFKAQYVDAFEVVKQQRALGEIKTISLSEYRPPFLEKVNEWNKFNARSGGTLVEKCCHYFDLINQMAAARPVSVFASGGRAVNFLDFEYGGKTSDIDDHAFVIIEYDNGLRANFTLNMFCRELYEEMVVTGERGRAAATESATFRRSEPSRASLQVEVEGHRCYTPQAVGYPKVIEESGHYGATFFEHDAFIDRLEGIPAGGATAAQGLWAMIIASAAQESIEHRTVIEIDAFLEARGVNPTDPCTT